MLAITWLATAAGAEDSPRKDAPPRIEETQLTLRVGPIQGRATVIARTERTLTVLTAAHFLGEADAGKWVQIDCQGLLRGRIASVSRNPGFRPLRSRTSDEASTFGTLGVDSAIALIEVEVNDDPERQRLEQIRSAELTRTPIPAHSNQILAVHIVDQFGKEHTLRAGNHKNPKCLVWGRRGYDTQRGDSGAGVFVLRVDDQNQSWPMLIGTVSQTDDRGAVASLTARSDGWIDQVFRKTIGEPR